MCSSDLSLLDATNIVGRSGQVNRQEAPQMAVDDDPSTKWCDTSANAEKFIDFDLGSVRTLNGWYVCHAAAEAPEYITDAFALKVRDSRNKAWKTVDEVTKNSDPETNRKLSAPVQARFVRLSVTRGTQSGENVARIYEFSVY